MVDYIYIKKVIKEGATTTMFRMLQTDKAIKQHDVARQDVSCGICQQARSHNTFF